MEDNPVNYKTLILARYLGEFLQATRENATVRKTSAQIVMDLRPVAEFSINEVAENLIRSGYTIEFDESTPVWLMRQEPNKQLPIGKS